jgi:hypothetical protein
MVVPVLMVSCHVELNAKRGPVRAHTTTVIAARMKAEGRPTALEAARDRRVNTGWRSDDMVADTHQEPCSYMMGVTGLLGVEQASVDAQEPENQQCLGDFTTNTQRC